MYSSCVCLSVFRTSSPMWLVLVVNNNNHIYRLSQVDCGESLKPGFQWFKHTRWLYSLKGKVTYEGVDQRPQPVQIICICPDICAFSVLHLRHLSDICAFCQKCQFEGKKGWQVLLLQSKAEDMRCKQADSAILRLLLVQGPWTLKVQWDKYILSQNRLMWWLRAFVATWAMSHLRAYCRESRFVTNTRFFGFVLSRLLLRHLGFDSDFAQISEQKIGGWGLWGRYLHEIHLLFRYLSWSRPKPPISNQKSSQPSKWYSTGDLKRVYFVMFLLSLLGW